MWKLEFADDGVGIVVRRNSDEVFEQRVEALIATLRQQMALYDAEQRTLQVLYRISVTCD